MEPFWTKNYPKNIPAEINADQYANLNELVDLTVARFRSQPAYSNMGAKLSFEEVDRYSRAFASYLQNTLGIQKGDSVAIMMPNLLQYPVSVLAILRTGASVINVNPMYTARELRHLLTNSQAKSVIILENFAKTLAEILPETSVQSVIIARIGDLLPFPKNHIVNFAVKYIKRMVPCFKIPQALSWTEVLKKGDASRLKKVKIDAEDIAFLQYTGGTTGVSKGAMLTHRNIISNTLQILSWFTANPDFKLDRAVCPLPLYHIFALLADCFGFFALGAESILITNPRDIKGFIKTIKNVRFTGIIGVNTLFKHLLNHPDFKSIDFSHLKISLGGGAAVEKSVAEAWAKATGCVLLEAYGLTEASPAVAINPPSLDCFAGTVGLPLPSTLISIRDENAKELGINEEGELWVKGPQVFKGYYKDEEETKRSLQDGWLKTGDIAKINEQGFISIMDRKKDLIIVSGFNVYPNEIEDVVTHHPKVLEACAVAVPDEKTGEAVRLFVVRKDESLTEAELLAHCRKNLVNYKMPRSIVWRKDLPKSNVGKILRKELKSI